MSGPAFPVSSIDGFTQHGMSLRDWFAGQAVIGLLAHSVHDHCPLFGDGHPFARDAYIIAAAMLAEREKLSSAESEEVISAFVEENR